MTLDALRAQFPHTEDLVYLDHAATGPLSTPVMEVVSAYLAQRHRTKPNNYFDLEPLVEAARQRAATVLGADPARVDFVPNTSSAINLLAQGLDWQPGDRVAVPACEFPTNVYPWIGLEKQGVALDFIPHDRGTFTVEDVERAIRPQTRVVSVSWVQFLSGFRADLDAIGTLCRARDILFCVDAIQGLGALRLDVTALPIDFLACGSHKWLLGPQGIGLFYVTEALQSQLTPVRGWMNGPIDWDDFLSYPTAFHDDARRFRTGTMNHVGILGLGAALRLYLDAGPEWCETRVLARTAEVAAGAERLGLRRYGSADPAHASGITVVEHPEPEGVFEALAAQNVHVAVRDRKLRIAPTYYNTSDEVERVLDGIAAYGKTSVAVG